MTPLDTDTLPASIRARFVHDINGLDVHVLEAGFEPAGRPLAVLLHGFPEIAYSWRKVMPALAEAGYQVVAPDLRGYGRTTGWSAELRRRPPAVPPAELRARRDGAGRGAGLSLRRRRWSGTISAPRSRPGARWRGPTCSARWR